MRPCLRSTSLLTEVESKEEPMQYVENLCSCDFVTRVTFFYQLTTCTCRVALTSNLSPFFSSETFNLRTLQRYCRFSLLSVSKLSDENIIKNFLKDRSH